MATAETEKTEIHDQLKVESAYGQWFIVDQENRVIAMSSRRWYAEILAYDYNWKKEQELSWLKGIEAKAAPENDGG